MIQPCRKVSSESSPLKEIGQFLSFIIVCTLISVASSQPYLSLLLSLHPLAKPVDFDAFRHLCLDFFLAVLLRSKDEPRKYIKSIIFS